MLRGSITALITPFADGAVDEKAFSAFIDWQISEGTHALVPMGTTGENPSVSHEEHHRIIEICVKTANKRVPVIAGCGSNSTAEAVSLTRFAEEVGSDAILSVVPYYNKPTQEGMFQHFAAVAIGSVITAALILAARTGGKAKRTATGVLALLNLTAYGMVRLAWRGYADPGIDNLLPFQLCDIAAFLAGFALLTHRRTLCDLTYFWGLAATTQALLTPAIQIGFPSWPFIVFFIQHFAVVAAFAGGDGGRDLVQQAGGKAPPQLEPARERVCQHSPHACHVTSSPRHRRRRSCRRLR